MYHSDMGMEIVETPVDTPEKFGQLIRMRRVIFDYTQENLAEKAGVSRMAIKRLEAGNPNVRLDTALKAAQAVGVPLPTILEGNPK